MEHTTTDLIDDRKKQAEIDSYAKTGSQGGWAYEYGRDLDLKTLRHDFLWMRAEITRLRAINHELTYSVEAKS